MAPRNLHVLLEDLNFLLFSYSGVVGQRAQAHYGVIIPSMRASVQFRRRWGWVASVMGVGVHSSQASPGTTRADFNAMYLALKRPAPPHVRGKQSEKTKAPASLS